MRLVTPLHPEQLPDINQVAVTMKTIPATSGSDRLCQFEVDIQATSVEVLWPGCKSPPPAAQILAFEAVHMLIPPRPIASKTKYGRKSESENWRKEEVKNLFAII